MSEIVQLMKDFGRNIVSGVALTDILDILIVAFVIYKILEFIRESRAEQLVKGILFIIFAMLVSDALHLYTLNWILNSAMTLGAFAIVIIFQPELRNGLEHMGRGRWFRSLIKVDSNQAKKIIENVVQAIKCASEKKTGELIVLEQRTPLTNISQTGTFLNADISAEIIGNIFYEGAPLHDGAVIIRGDKIYAAACVLPLTENKNLPSELGTRHRAGIGISEISDAFVLIVSEETGQISIAREGKIRRNVSYKTVERELRIEYGLGEDDDKNTVRKAIDRVGRKRNV
mgnify:FL=1